MPPEASRFRPAKGVTASEDGDGIVLFHAREGLLFGTKKMGARIWRGVEREMPSDGIAAEVSREHHLPSTTAEEYTNQFLAELRRQKLIEPVPES